MTVKKTKVPKVSTPPSPLQLSIIKPKTINQNKTFNEYNTEKNLLLHGTAGSGKTFIALYLALDEILDKSDKSIYNSIIIIRSVVPTREIGFLPGSAAEKSQEFELPYQGICQEIFNNKDAYKSLKNKEIIEFKTTSFIRGTTLNNCIVIVDEIQNMDIDELRSVITRMGENTKIILIGDFKQSDFRGKDKIYKNDVVNFINIIKNMKDDFSHVEFTTNDIVRSKLVKNFLIEEERYFNSL